MLWQLFQQRNKRTQTASNILLFSPNKSTGSTMKESNASGKAIHFHELNGKNKNLIRFPHPSDMLRPVTVPRFPVPLPVIGPERPFNPLVVLTSEAMFQILGVRHYNEDYMAFRRPWEATAFPSGHLSNGDVSGINTRRLRDILHAILKAKPQTTNRFPQKWLNRTKNQSAYKWDMLQQEFGHISSTPNKVNRKQRYSFQRRPVFKEGETRRYTRGTKAAVNRQHSGRLHFRLVQTKRFRQKLRRTLRRLITEYSNCPVHYIWKDQGAKYWPRWVKQGQCTNLKGKSCSIPPGMYCHEANYINLVVLRYLCLEDWPLTSCNWYRMHMPVLTQCRCGCTNMHVNSTKTD
ncbi:noggin [Paragonimus westermani]|uniref:Noggin n=1 Tax=Paragonimus westermani TaxID=34504 RepID=A0A5J4NUH6_9TREM|nr:noggin [Paragonimus westermani]